MTSPPSSPGADRAAVVSALLLVAAAPPSPLPLLVLGALAPLLAALARLPPGPSGRLRAFRAGAIHGAVAWGLLLLWLPRAAPRVGAWTLLAWVAVVSTLSLFSGGAAVGVHRLAAGRRLPLPVAAALAWGGVEWIRSAWIGPLNFPWMGLALPLAGVPSLIQGAAWVGEIGLVLAVAAVNGVVAGALSVPRPRAVRRLALLGAGILVVGGVGRARMERAAVTPTVRALLVQPAVPLAVKRGDDEAALEASLAAVDAALPPPGPPVAPPVGGDLVVLPETAVPVALDGPDAAPVRARVAGWARRMGAPVLVGAWAQGEGRGANAVFLASPDPSAPWPVSRKERLVPGVEWIPGRPEASVERGRPAVLSLPGGTALGPLVCIESAGSEPALRQVRAGADVLVAVTNDAWLAEAPWWTRTAAFHQHPAHLAFRSVETGVGALRVGNNGLTEVVDPLGRRQRVVAPHGPGVASVTAHRLVRPPPFVALGPWLGPVAALGLVLAVGAPVRGRGAAPVDPS